MNVRACLGIALVVPGLAWSASLNTEVRDPRIGYWIEDKISASYPQAEGLQLSFEDLGGGLIRYKLGAKATLVEKVSEDGNFLTGTATYRDASGKFLREVHRRFSRRR